MSEPPDDLDRERVAAALERVRAGVKQRQAVLAATRGAGDEGSLALAELRERELVREPLAESPRPVVGRLLVVLRRAGFHLFVKWWARPVLGQQNAFNQAASRAVDELARERARDAEAAARLARRVEELEARVALLEAGRGRAAGE